MDTTRKECALASGSSDAVLGGGLPHVYGNREDAKVSLREYLEAVRQGDQALQEERDRRYAEVKAAEEKALKVKETADAIALGLQRDYQAYKDLQANNLREQISSERGTYVTRTEFETANKPVVEFVLQQRAILEKRGVDITQIIAVLAVVAAVVSSILFALKK
jgi:vacuolar-type H+-ATPase subunit H